MCHLNLPIKILFNTNILKCVQEILLKTEYA